MIPLPIERVEAFERWLCERWLDRSYHGARGALVCSFGMLGLRWCEVERSRPDDLMPGSDALFVRTGKRGRPRTIEAPAGLLVAAIELRGRVAGGDDRTFVTRKGRGLVYQDIRRFVARATRAVFGRAYSFHCFRHTAAVRVWERTRDVLAVQRYLGHKSLVWTNDYLSTLCPPLLGGPVAFAGGGKVRKPRLYDPDGVGEVVEVRSVACRKGKRRGKAAAAGDEEAFEVDGGKKVSGDGDGDRDGDRVPGPGEHRCREYAVVLRSGEGVVFRCTICDRVLTGPEDPAIGKKAPSCDHATPWCDEFGRARGSWGVFTRSKRAVRSGRIVKCRVCGRFYGGFPVEKRR